MSETTTVPTTGPVAGAVAIDGHVHLYPEADLGRLFTAARDNLTRACPRATAIGLLLTETARDDAFAALASGSGVPPGWSVRSFPEDSAALEVDDGAGRPLLLVAGRQIVTAEGLEVLAPATALRFADGRPVAEVLAELHAAGAPAILPWGLGKWLGARGGRVTELFAVGGAGLLAGDNAGRPPFWPRPAVFDRAPMLPGTDPLPVPGAETDVGRYGFVLEGGLDPQRPAADLAARLFALASQPAVIGRRQGLGQVIARQRALRRRKGRGA